MKTGVRRVTIRRRSDDLRCDVVRGIGWRARCECGHPFKLRDSREEAATDRKLHEAWGCDQ